jgi:hypothetical protein
MAEHLTSKLKTRVQAPILKKKKKKEKRSQMLDFRAGGMAQVVQRLPSKCETLSSNASISKKKRK